MDRKVYILTCNPAKTHLTVPEATESTYVKRLVNRYNLVANLLWSLLTLLPLTIFCYTQLEPLLFYVFLILSFLPLLFPNAWFDKMQLGKTTQFYKLLGVPFLNRFAQNGAIVNKLIKKKFPGYKVVHYNKRMIHKRHQQTYFYEKFHFVLFVFFCFMLFVALHNGQWGWALFIVVSNVLYNIYPILLQQYIRMKLRPYAVR